MSNSLAWFVTSCH